MKIKDIVDEIVNLELSNPPVTPQESKIREYQVKVIIPHGFDPQPGEVCEVEAVATINTHERVVYLSLE